MADKSYFQTESLSGNWEIERYSEEEILEYFKENVTFYRWYQTLQENFKKEILHFFMGCEMISVTYDPFFLKLLNPELHPERLEHLLSAILARKVKIVRILQREGVMINENASFVIMDVVVQTEEGSYINVEMQKIGYDFPVERADCYTADMIMRQYSDLKAEKAKRREKFRFREMSPVITVVLMEKSPKQFYVRKDECGNNEKEALPYLHKRYSVFDTGIDGSGLCSNYFVCLDIFKKTMHTDINNEKEAWLYFLTSKTVEDIRKVCSKYPEFTPMYEEMFAFRRNLEVFMSSFSEALRIMDRNEERYMVEDLKDEVAELSDKNAELSDKNEKLQNELEALKKELQELKAIH